MSKHGVVGTETIYYYYYYYVFAPNALTTPMVFQLLDNIIFFAI